MIRLFVGLELPPLIKDRLALLRGGLEGARWQREDQFHLTLRFIGEVPRATANDVALALENVDFTPFDVGLQGVGNFDTKKRARALWVDVADRRPLEHLHDKIDRALIGADLAPEQRKYRPHVTIARFNGGRRVPQLEAWKAANMGFWLPAFTVGEFALFQSHLATDGARYEVIERYGATGANFSHDDMWDQPEPALAAAGG